MFSPHEDIRQQMRHRNVYAVEDDGGGTKTMSRTMLELEWDYVCVCV